jgi:CHAT domain-containing protein
MRSVRNLAHLPAQQEALDDFHDFRAYASQLTQLLRNMNTLTQAMHEDTDFSALINALEKRIAPAGPLASPAGPASTANQSEFLKDVELLNEFGLQPASTKLRVPTAAALPSKDGRTSEEIGSAQLPGQMADIGQEARKVQHQTILDGGPTSSNSAPPAASPVPGSALLLSVQNSNVKFVSTPLMLGHYLALKLTGAEYVVDRFFGGTMSASLATGLYPEAPGSHLVFVNTQQSLDNPLGLPRPPQVVVVGLGEEGKLRSAELVRSVCQATIGLAQRVAERTMRPTTVGLAQSADASPNEGDRHFKMAATLIGSGGSGISVETSARAVAQGVRRANERLGQSGWPVCSHLCFVELYRDRASDALRALRMLVQASPGQFTLTPALQVGPGALPKTLVGGYRGVNYDLLSVVTDSNEFGEPKFVYTLDTHRTRSGIRALSYPSPRRNELISRASNDANRDTQIGRTLFQMLVPVDLEESLTSGTELLLELDDGTAAIPWELLEEPNYGGGHVEPWAIRAKLVRRLLTVEFRQQVSDSRPDDGVLVIGEPLADPKLYPALPGARAEAEAVRAVLSQGLDASRVRALIASGDNLGPDAATVVDALLSKRYRIVHIVGHGAPEEMRELTPLQPRGVVLSDDTFFGPREIYAMRVVPELVFLNCCHLALDPDKLLKVGYDRASFAASMAKQLIRIGVRCVVVAGWAVDDDAASGFATAFYNALLTGHRFMDAVYAARVEARRISPNSNTWAAYQCYGDPDWVWHTGNYYFDRPPATVAPEVVNIESPADLAAVLETLTVRSFTQGADSKSQRDKISNLEVQFGATWGGVGAVAEAFGVACVAARDNERAIHWFRRSLIADDAGATVKASQALANLLARLAWERVARAPREGKSQAIINQLLSQGRSEISEAIHILGSLVSMAPTIETESLLGSAYKRLALLESMAGKAKPEANAIAKMAEHYGRAEALAFRSQSADFSYPALQRMAAELITRSSQRGWKGFHREDLAKVSESLAGKIRADPDFWSVVSVTEMSVYQALATKGLAAQLPAILTAYKDLHSRADSPWMWAAVADQMGFVLKHFSEGSSAETAAAKQLQGLLRAYAGQ